LRAIQFPRRSLNLTAIAQPLIDQIEQ